MTPICIAGMHGSGTSLTAQLLHRCGVHLGNESVLVAPDNPDGFWEDTRFVAINDAILGAFGGAWDYPPLMAQGWTEDGRLTSVRENAEALLAEYAEQETPWGWKDPRNSLTFPFWRRYFPTMKVVFCLRNPLAVAHSLFARSRHSYILGLHVWYRYAISFLDSVPPDQRIVTAYDAYFSDAHAELARVLAFLDITVPTTVRNRALAAVSSGLRHPISTEQQLHEAGISAAIVDLYARLREEACLPAGHNEPDKEITVTAMQQSAVGDTQPAHMRRAEDAAESAIPANARAPLPIEDIGHFDVMAMETTRLRFELEDVRVRFASLEARYRKLEREHHDIEQQLRDSRTEYGELAAYCRKLEQEFAVRDAARQETVSYTRSLEEQVRALTCGQEHVARYVLTLQQQVDDLKSEQGQAADYIRMLEGQLAAMEDEQKRTTGYVRILEVQLAALREEYERTSIYVQLLEKEQVQTLAGEQSQATGYIHILEEQLADSKGEQEQATGYVQTLEEQLAALKDEQEQATGYVQTLERQLFTVHRARQEAEIRIISLEQQIAQQRGTSHPAMHSR
ncbi:MAG TPA: sulfotransferase [Gemmatimonadaceae bacterium]